MSDIKPALTAEEWTVRYIVTESRGAWVSGDGAEWLGYDDTERLTWKGREHAVAALALYDQPFGFRSDQVSWLREEAAILRRAGASAGALMCDELADRIESLLPPEKEGA